MTDFTAQSRYYDNSRLADYKECPRKYFIRHMMGWTRDGNAVFLNFGSAWHDSMDVVWKHAKSFPKDELLKMAMLQFNLTWTDAGMPDMEDFQGNEMYSPRTPGIAGEMLHNYIAERSKMLAECTVLSIEQPFAIPLPHLDNIWYVGRLDKVVEYGIQTLILEHKTTTAYATAGNFRSDWVEIWYSSPQCKGYQFGGSLFYPKLDGVWVDGALVHKKIHDAFKFIPVNHHVDLLAEWVGYTNNWVQRVAGEEEAYKEAGVLKPGMFPKNEDSCFGKYGTCQFLDICRTVADPTSLPEPPPGFKHEPWEPYSLLGLDKLIKEKEDDPSNST